MISLTTITAMEIFMKTYDCQGKLIKEDNNTTSIAYVQCSCGCLASRVSSDSDKFKCSLCKRVHVLKKRPKIFCFYIDFKTML
ncbi:excinuclease ABC subunit C [Enterococcus faecalis]|uniref:excinuclease ABC subunit C n=1 Tax=Enterococcus faecalis TaxID=1351 RepID=UPI001E321510|nr:excinuclease ABC subunit C [Enterococcus faecalis]MDU6565174.1 excinuclease ABC subunit C [Enterococcus faecalis]